MNKSNETCSLKKRILLSWKNIILKGASNKEELVITNQKEKIPPTNQKARKTVYYNEEWRKPTNESNLEQLKRYQQFLDYLQEKKESEASTVSHPSPNLNQQTTSAVVLEKVLGSKNKA